MSDDITELYQQVILDHCKRPRHFHVLEEPTCSAQGRNPLCGDELQLYVRTEGDRLAAVSFVGSGCCISKASASLLTEAVLGRTKAEVAALFQQVRQLVTTGTSSGGGLGKLAVFAGVYKFPARVKCAMLPWHAVLAAIEGQSAPVTTESESQ